MPERDKTMCMLDVLRAKRDEIDGIARRHKAEKLWVFGSVARKEETPHSDVDLLVKFADGASLFDQGSISYHLGKCLGRTVDVVDYGTYNREPFFKYLVSKDLQAL